VYYGSYRYLSSIISLGYIKKEIKPNENLKEELEILKDINFEQIVDLLSR
jgi:hypothetical protein